MKITLTYGLRTLGFDAEEINSGRGNTIAKDLIDAATIIVLEIIGQEPFPQSRSMAPPFIAAEESLNQSFITGSTTAANSNSDYNAAGMHHDHLAEQTMKRYKAPRKDDSISAQEHQQGIFDKFGRRSFRRKLVSMSADFPVFHSRIIQDGE